MAARLPWVVIVALGHSLPATLPSSPRISSVGCRMRSLLTPARAAKGFGDSTFRNRKMEAHELVELRRREEEERRERAKKKKKPKKWDFDELSEAWDDVFQELTEDPDYAREILDESKEYHETLGRGFMFIRSEVKTRPPLSEHVSSTSADDGHRSAANGGVGYFEHPELGEVVGLSEDLLLTSMEHDYVTTEELKAVAKGGARAAPRLGAELAASLQEACSRMDVQQVVAMTTGESDSGLEDVSSPYRPSWDELVIVLQAHVDGNPIVGADLVRASEVEDGEEGDIVLVSPAIEQLMAEAEVDDIFNTKDD